MVADDLKTLRPYMAMAGGALILLAVVCYRHIVLKQGYTGPSGEDHSALFDQWQNLNYSPIDNQQSIYGQLSLAQVESDTSISPDQHQKFLRDATAYLWMYQASDPSTLFTQYLEAREPVKLNGDPSAWVELEQNNSIPLNTPPEVFVPKIVELSHTQKQFLGMAGSSTSIRYFEVQKTTMPYRGLIDTTEDMSKNLPSSVGFNQANKLFEFQEDFNSQYDQDLPVKIGEIDTYMKGMSDPHAERFLIRFVWCPTAGEWRPLEIVSDNDVHGVALFLP